MTDDAAAPSRVKVRRDGTVTTITLAQPHKRNVLADATLRELIQALQDVASTDSLAVVIDAEGPVFSAGHDFRDMAGADYDEARTLLDTCADMMQLIGAIPQVVVAKVHALATAAGCQLVAACDLAVASESASFAAPGGKGGLFCHTPMVAIARAVGRKRGLELAMTGDAIDARTACAWGLVNRVVPDDELDDATAELVRRVTRGSPTSKAAGKHAYYSQIDMGQPEAYEFASHVMALGATAEDGQEGIASFIQKRRPSYGRPEWVGEP